MTGVVSLASYFYFLLPDHPVQVSPIVGRAGHVVGEIRRVCSGVTSERNRKERHLVCLLGQRFSNAIHITGAN